MNRLTGSQLTDTSNGYRALRVELLADVVDRLEQRQYQTAELLITAISRGWRVTERPDRVAAPGLGGLQEGLEPVLRVPLRQASCWRTWLRERGGRVAQRGGVVVGGLQALPQRLGQPVDLAPGHPAPLGGLARRSARRSTRSPSRGLGNFAPLGMARSLPKMPDRARSAPRYGAARKATPSRSSRPGPRSAASPSGNITSTWPCAQHLLGAAHRLAVGPRAVHREDAEGFEQVGRTTRSFQSSSLAMKKSLPRVEESG